MKSILKLFTLSLIGLQLSMTSSAGAITEEMKKVSMCRDLEVLKHTFDVNYAPADWKKQSLHWEMEVALEEAKNKIKSTQNITTKEFHKIARQFLNSANDHHVQIEFCSTESAFLPFTVKKAEGIYYINWIDREAISDAHYAIFVGDELLEFDGKPVEEVIASLKSAGGWNSDLPTYQAFAEIILTNRKGKRGEDIPEGPVGITLRSAKDDSIRSFQLMWDYQPESIKNPADMDHLADSIFPLLNQENKRKKIASLDMCTPAYSLYKSDNDQKEGALGSYKSFVPPLGKITWENEEECQFHAYIYQNKEGKRIGYVRIPTYVGDQGDIEEFGKIISYYQKNTDALVIDQLHNPGGRVNYHYGLASMLTNRPLVTPKHHLKLTHQDVLSAFEDLNILKHVKSNDDAMLFFPDDPYMNYEYALFEKEFVRFIIKEWNAGRIFTRPVHLGGVDHINPHPKYNYTKPILILINEMDFSCADFFPAIMQDNKRATLFGMRTAGAGGCVDRANLENSNGISKFSYTYTIAERVDKQLIENVGIAPDIEYQITAQDLQKGYIPYIKAVNNAVQDLLKVKSKEEPKPNLEEKPTENPDELKVESKVKKTIKTI
ncbi:MAG: protease-like activity factor CPAF [Parachlamydiaceae bacterium]|nr:protease-like activity factor CPAF [Parachlamydiaceae bacterium]